MQIGFGYGFRRFRYFDMCSRFRAGSYCKDDSDSV